MIPPKNSSDSNLEEAPGPVNSARQAPPAAVDFAIRFV